MLLSVFCFFILSLIESARTEIFRYETEIYTDIALRSCFAEYNKELFERFDLFFADTGYRSDEGGLERFVEHLRGYVEANTENKGEVDLLRIRLDEISVNSYRLASDKEGEAMVEQAVIYIDKYGNEELERGPKADKYLIDEYSHSDFTNEWDSVLSCIGFEHGDESLYPFMAVRNRVLDSEQLLRGSYMYLKSLNNMDLPSKRELNKGVYPRERTEDPSEEESFNAYLMEKLGCYTEYDSMQALRCELEYMIFGNENDRENMERITDLLMSYREGINLEYIRNSEYMLSLADEKAREYCESMGDMQYEIREAIIYSWAYAESVIEVNRLLCGGRCEPDTEGLIWIIPIDDMMFFPEYLGEGEGEGLSYRDYLEILLYTTEYRDKRMRFMDIVEMDIRNTGYPAFKIDNCIGYADVTMKYESGYGYRREVTDEYAYDSGILD